VLHRDLGDDEADGGVQPGEGDARGLPDQAVSTVAADEVVRPKGRVVGQLDIDAGIVLDEAHHLAATEDRHPELVGPAGQDALEVGLPEREKVVVAAREVADVQGDLPVAHMRMSASCYDEPVSDAALIQHLDGARVQPFRA
jgi:hypothetical protein